MADSRRSDHLYSNSRVPEPQRPVVIQHTPPRYPSQTPSPRPPSRDSPFSIGRPSSRESPAHAHAASRESVAQLLLTGNLPNTLAGMLQGQGQFPLHPSLTVPPTLNLQGLPSRVMPNLSSFNNQMASTAEDLTTQPKHLQVPVHDRALGIKLQTTSMHQQPAHQPANQNKGLANVGGASGILPPGPPTLAKMLTFQDIRVKIPGDDTSFSRPQFVTSFQPVAPVPQFSTHADKSVSDVAPNQRTAFTYSDDMPTLEPVQTEKAKHNSLPQQLVVKKEEKKEKVKEEDEKMVPIFPFNQRVNNLANIPLAQTTYRSAYRSHSVAVQRAKMGSITGTAKTLDLMRQNLQKWINKEIDGILQRYIDEFFKPAIENIKLNNGEDSVGDEHVHAVSKQILEEAKKMYGSQEGRSVTPIDNTDNVSEAGSHSERRSYKNLFSRRRKHSDTDSEASQPIRKRKKGRPPLQAQSGRSTPMKTGKAHEPVKREGPKWDPERLKIDTQFIMGARANKSLGLGATRGRLYIKHPEVFKYSGDQDDKQWLYEHHHMPATGGKAYMLLVEDIKELSQTDEYRDSPLLLPNDMTGFSIPEWMMEKVKIQMQANRTDNVKPSTKTPSLTPRDVALQEPADLAETVMELDKNLPFTTADSSQKSLADGKSDLQTSPASTAEMDLLSTEDQDEPNPASISPFHMAGGLSPAYREMSPTPSDLDGLDDDAPLTAPFDFK